MRLLFGLCCCLLSWPSWAQTFRFVTLQYPPYVASTMPNQGAMVEVLQKALGEQYQIKIEFMPFSRVLSEVKAGKAAGVIGMWPINYVDTSQLLQPSPTVFVSHLGFYTRNSIPALPVELSQIKGQVIGTVRLYGYTEQLQQSGAIFEDVYDDQTNLRKLAAGRIDRVVLERAVGQYLLQSQELKTIAHRVVWREPSFAALPLTIGFAQGAPRSAELREAFSQGLARLAKSGELRAIAERHQIDLQ